MHKYFLVLLILLTACAPAGPQQSAAVQTDNNIPTTASAELPASLPPTPTTPSQPSNEGTAAQPPAESTAGTLWVRVVSHQDGDTVNTPTIMLKGQAPADAVVTVNDDIILVSNDQSFGTEVKLEAGPNLIEIVASDLNGNEVYLPLTIDYEP